MKRRWAIVGVCAALAASAEAGVITFTDFTVSAELTAVEQETSCACTDFEGDGDLDLATFGDGRVYLNNGQAVFTDITSESALLPTYPELLGGFGDVNNDGFPDAFIASADFRGANFLLGQDGIHFLDMTAALGVNDAYGYGPAWSDIDQDGRLDFYVGAATLGSPEARARLHMNRLPLAFSDEWSSRGLDYPDGRFNLWFDWEEDGDPDLYIGVGRGNPQSTWADRLYRNDGSGHFSWSPSAINSSPERTSGVQLADFDADGRLDLLVLETVPVNQLDEPPPVLNKVWRDNGDGTFANIAPALNLTMPGFVFPNGPRDWKLDAVVADFDNDMDPDVFVALWNARVGGEPPNELWLNEGGVYVERGAEAGLLEAVNSYSCLAADFNGDGFLDIYVTHDNGFGTRDTLWLNNGNGNHWLEIDPTGVQSNRDAFGLRAWVTAGGVTQVQELYSSTNHPARLHFGLGPNKIVEHLVLRWPLGLVEEYTDIPADQLLRLVEGGSVPHEAGLVLH